MDFDLLLFDRIEKIRQINDQYDLEHNSYISFSGGKDSTVLHYLIDIALPNNNIPRVFMNTGVEYLDIVKFVKSLAMIDTRFVLLSSGINIKYMQEQYGYPFKSKEHSHILSTFQHSGLTKSVKYYLSLDGNKMNVCPKKLRYQFSSGFLLKVSDKCCYQLKKLPLSSWSIFNNKSVTLTGMRSSEGGQRASINCIVTDRDNNLKKFHPLLVVSDEWEDEFIKRYSIKLCRLYYPPFNFKRTGCKGCPFSLNLQKDLDTMLELLPAERKQCEILWGKVYAEYRRLGYRLRPQFNLFELNILNVSKVNFKGKEGDKHT